MAVPRSWAATTESARLSRLERRARRQSQVTVVSIPVWSARGIDSVRLARFSVDSHLGNLLTTTPYVGTDDLASRTSALAEAGARFQGFPARGGGNCWTATSCRAPNARPGACLRREQRLRGPQPAGKRRPPSTTTVSSRRPSSGRSRPETLRNCSTLLLNGRRSALVKGTGLWTRGA